MIPPSELPSVTLLPRTHGSRIDRAWRWLQQPPRWASQPGRWAISAGIAAILLHGFSMMLHRILVEGAPLRPGALFLGVGEAISINFSIFFSGLLLALPLALSGQIFFSFFSRRTPLLGALWCAAFHATAHATLFLILEWDFWANLQVPILVGALWGLWLPRTREHEQPSLSPGVHLDDAPGAHDAHDAPGAQGLEK